MNNNVIKFPVNPFRIERNKIRLPKKIKNLFFKFESIWGNRWFSESLHPGLYHMALYEWSESIKPLWITEEIMDSVIDKFRCTMEWPPSIAEFLNLCKEEQQWKKQSRRLT